MLIKSERLRTSAGYKRILNHLNNGEDNENIVKWNGDTLDVKDWYEDASRYNRTYAVRHWIISPYENLNTDQFNEIIADLSKEFGFDSNSTFIREHLKARAVESASSQHWHVLVPEVDAATGKVMATSRDYIRHEKLARIWEHRWDLRPVAGAHNAAVLASLRAERRLDVAAWMEAAFSIGEKPHAPIPGRVHQALKRRGIDASIVRVNARRAWEETTDAASFRDRLATHGLSVRFGDRRWIVETIQGAFVGIAPSMVGAKTAEFARRMDNGTEKDNRGRKGPRRDSDHATTSQGTSTATEFGGIVRDGVIGYINGDDAGSLEIDVYDHDKHRQTKYSDTSIAWGDFGQSSDALRVAVKSLVRQILPQRNAIAVLSLNARLLARPPLERMYDALEASETDARESIQRSEFHLVAPVPEPPSLLELRKNAKAAADILDAARRERADAQAAVEAHQGSRPGFWGWATDSRRSHAEKHGELERHRASTLAGEQCAEQAWTQARNRLDVALTRWKPVAIEQLRQMHIEARDAKAALPIFESVRHLLQGSPHLAYRGLPWLLDTARRPDPGNGLAVQDMWGVGLLEPDPQPRPPR